MRHVIRGFAFATTAAALLMLVVAGGCGDNGNGGGGGGPPPPPPPQLGRLNLEITSAEFPATGNPIVTFRAFDENRQPVDVRAEMAAAAPATRIGNLRFTLAQLQDDGTYLSLFESTQAGAPFTVGGTSIPAAIPEGANQATFAQVAPAAAAERLQEVGPGTYRVELIVADPTRVRTDLDRNRTHTAGMWATRTFGPAPAPGEQADIAPANATLNFVPTGTGTVQRDEVVIDQACNVCHGQLRAHDNRTGVQLCITCHSPQSVDPQTGNSVDMAEMVHKIHRGAALPSVVQGQPYRIVGFGSNVFDFSGVNFPRAITDCTACHQGEDAGRWRTAASVRACNSCHDNVRLRTAEFNAATVTCGPGVTQPCRHSGGPIPPTTACTVCHTGPSVEAAHVNQLAVNAARFRYELVSAGLDAERRPVVRFRVVDPTNNNTAWDIKTAAPYQQGSSALNVLVSWGTGENPGEITNEGTNRNFGQPISMAAIANSVRVEEPGVAPNTFQITSSAAAGINPANATIPEGVNQVFVSIEGRPVVNGRNIPVPNLVQPVAFGGAAPPVRRTIVSTQKCNDCHGILTAHGANRNDNVLACAVCHNANATDRLRRPADPASTPDNKVEESIDFKTMVHSIHAVGVKVNPITFYGFGNVAHTFPHGTGNVGNCNVCHEGTSYLLPLQVGVRDTTIGSGENLADPSDNVRVAAARAVCQSCHDRPQAIAHMDALLAARGPNGCAECHAPGGQSPAVDISIVHPVTTRP